MKFILVSSLLLITPAAAKDVKQIRHRQMVESHLQPSGGSFQKCVENCDKKLKDEDETIDCQQDCNAAYSDSTRSLTLTSCIAACAEDAEDKYKKESKDSTDSEAQSEAKKEYKSCLKKCFPNEDSIFTVLKGADVMQ